MDDENVQAEIQGGKLFEGGGDRSGAIQGPQRSTLPASPSLRVQAENVSSIIPGNGSPDTKDNPLLEVVAPNSTHNTRHGEVESSSPLPFPVPQNPDSVADQQDGEYTMPESEEQQVEDAEQEMVVVLETLLKRPSEEEQPPMRKKPLVVHGLPQLWKGSDGQYDIPGLGSECGFQENRDWWIWEEEKENGEKEKKVIGEGSYGTCYLALAKECNTTMCVKQLQRSSEQQNIEDIQKEISVLAKLEHENIVQFLGATYEDNKFNIFMEWLGKTMGEYMLQYKRKKKKMGETAILNLSIQLMRATRYIHSKGIIHGDLHAGNILVDHSGQTLCVADFGNKSSFRMSSGEGDSKIREDEQQCGDIVCKMMALPKSLEHYTAILRDTKLPSCFVKLVDECCDDDETVVGLEGLDECINKLRNLRIN